MQKRGIRRRLFTLFAALSLFVFIFSLVNAASATLRKWCSLPPSVDLYPDAVVNDWGFVFDGKGWGCHWVTLVKPYAWRAPHSGESSELLGFIYARRHPVTLNFTGGRSFVVAQRSIFQIPYWFILTASAIAPGLWLRGAIKMLRTHRRLQAGCCVKCGYDLRASPDRCPECGRMPVTAVR